MLIIDPNERITIDEIWNHPWILKHMNNESKQRQQNKKKKKKKYQVISLIIIRILILLNKLYLKMFMKI